MPTRHKVTTTDEFPTNGSPLIVDVDGREVAIFSVDDEFHAMLNYCVHQGGPLCEGSLTGRTVVNRDSWEWEYDATEKNVLCPWHGWMFDVTTGVCVDENRYTVPTYDVEIDDDDIYVVV